MGALPRVAALYRLLERVRESEAMAASAEVALSDAKLQQVAEKRQTAIENAHRCAGDPIARAISAQMQESCDVLAGRLALLRERQRNVQQNALADLARSRLQVRQVEVTLEQQRAAEEAESSKRAQAFADERHLIQRYRGRQ